MSGMGKHGQAGVVAESVVSLRARGRGCCQRACVGVGSVWWVFVGGSSWGEWLLSSVC